MSEKLASKIVDATALVIVAVCITLIELKALEIRLDGQLFLTALGFLASLFGYYIGRGRRR